MGEECPEYGIIYQNPVIYDHIERCLVVIIVVYMGFVVEKVN